MEQTRQGSGSLALLEAESGGGKRALAILDQVQRDYCIDTDRVSLTGVSMGGQGTWSLAASDPKRWAAIVPVCHGGDTKSAARLKDIPCWCFHGDADTLTRRKAEPVAVSDTGGAARFACHRVTGTGEKKRDKDTSSRLHGETDSSRISPMKLSSV